MEENQAGHPSQTQEEEPQRERRLLETLELVTKKIVAAVIHYSRDLRFISANQEYANFLQRPLDEIVGHPISSVLGAEAFQTLRPYFERILAGETVTFEEELNYQDVGRRWVSGTHTPTIGPDGVVNEWVAVIVDITERKRAEEALRRREAELAESQRLARVGSWQWDPETDTVTWSEELYRLAGLDPNRPAVSYQEHSKLYTAESWERLRAVVEKALLTGTPYELDLEMVRTDGARLWLIARGEAQRDTTGRIVQLRGTVQDITESKRAMAALRESEERFRFVANTAPVVIWMTGPDKLCTYVNQVWLNFTGRPLETELGYGWAESIHPGDRQACVEGYTRAFDRRQPFTIEYRLRRHDGEYRWIFDSSIPRFEADGSFAGYIGSAVDVTDRKKTEEFLSSLSGRLIEAQEQERHYIARELHDDISQKLALLSVELQQYAQNVPNSQGQPGNRVESLMNHISGITNDVHALSHRLHSSKLETLGLVAAMTGFCRELAQHLDVKVDFTNNGVPRNLPPEVSLALFRVLQEGLTNAVRHSGVRQFEVRLARVSDHVELTIRDPGVGFDPGIAMYTQGLGLISMRERISHVKGTISIVSKSQGGTEIQVRVPVIPRTEEDQTTASA
jgi:PAS domain S-box-containing protein